jgi:pyridoxine 5-phosphate synthase
MNTRIRLGVNIDHVATLRNARGGVHPCPVRAALLAAEAGADGITAHLREDRRHIRDADIDRLRAEVPLPLNLEMAMTPEMLAIALRVRPHAVCLVPEKRQELTTEGGLDAAGLEAKLLPFVAQLRHAGIRVSLFVDAQVAQVEAARHAGADCVELHTGIYGENQELAELQRLREAARLAASLGLEVHAGHGLNYANVGPVAAILELRELNIGHFLMGEAIMRGMVPAVADMRCRMDEARA